MFGELIGLWLADLWERAGRPRVRYAELGPGRGTLAADALRAMRSAGLVPQVSFVETSPTLRAAQAKLVPDASWHDDIASLPVGEPLLVVANEFFDALPVRQVVATPAGWKERLVVHEGGASFRFPGLRSERREYPNICGQSRPGTVVETSPCGSGGRCGSLRTCSGGRAARP
jgi:SAM-dependent MidA family methyltransferase